MNFYLTSNEIILMTVTDKYRNYLRNKQRSKVFPKLKHCSMFAILIRLDNIKFLCSLHTTMFSVKSGQTTCCELLILFLTLCHWWMLQDGCYLPSHWSCTSHHSNQSDSVQSCWRPTNLKAEGLQANLTLVFWYDALVSLGQSGFNGTLQVI